MPKMTDQEFDNLFRQAANRISPGQEPGDWEDMQRRLEAAERDARARNISLYSMVALLLLYSFLMPDRLKFGSADRASLIPVVEQNDSGVPATESLPPAVHNEAEDELMKTHQANSTAADANTVASSKEKEQERATTPKTKAMIASAQHEIEPSSGQSGASAARGDGHDSGNGEGSTLKVNSAKNGEIAPRALNDNASNSSTHSAGAQAQALGSTQGSVNAAEVKEKQPVVVAQQSTKRNAPGESQTDGVLTSTAETGKQGQAGGEFAEPATAVATGSDASQTTAMSLPAQEKTVTPGNPRSMAAVIIADAPETPSTDPLQATPLQEPRNISLMPPGRVFVTETQGHPWFLKIAISPDFSSIDYGSAGKTGVNFGPMVEYGISPRFAVSTGAIWSKKLYDQQNPEKSYGTGGYTVHANKLVGDCRILDIPMNVTYYILPGRKTNLFITAGVSSYIMLKEEYVYTVSHNNNNYEYTENYSNENNEWFSMLNLSVGVQQQVARRWFIQGEPFLKAPMKGIGAGKVNLVSTGIFVSVKYRINP